MNASTNWDSSALLHFIIFKAISLAFPFVHLKTDARQAAKIALFFYGVKCLLKYF